MKILKGKYAEAKIYASIIDEETERQVKILLNQEFIKDCHVAIMPDCHAGKGCVIGTTMTIKDKIVPNLVGVDIGCGMLCVCLGKEEIDLKKLDSFIHENIPTGMNVNRLKTNFSVPLSKLKCYKDLKNRAYLNKSIGSLGGGNHFIEVDVSKDGTYYLIIHSGSRNLGKQVAEIYQNKAIKYHELRILDKDKIKNKIIRKYKKANRQKEIQKALEDLAKTEIELPMPKELCYLEGKNFNNYMFDMEICQEFAMENRKEIAKRIVKYLGKDFKKLNSFETIHNYINMQDKILRKGAISAYENEVVLIPVNMKDGCIIAKGKSNAEYNYSAPHGAGRIMSRSKAFKEIKIADFIESMQGIYSSTISKKTLDESPFVYKPLEAIIDNIKDTVEIIEIIKPIYNFKAEE